MAIRKWLASNGDWATAAYWSNGAVPGPLDDSFIGVAGSYTVVVTKATSTRSTTLTNHNVTLSVSVPGGTPSVSGKLTSDGTLLVDTSGAGGTSLAIGGRLTNRQLFQIGNGVLASTVTAQSLSNTGQIDIIGSSSSKQALLNIASAAPATWTGTVNLSGNALFEFSAKSQIRAIDANGTMNLSGPQAFVAAEGVDTKSNSALGSLSRNAGDFKLHLGAAVTTSVGLNNTGTVSSSRGATINIGGSLINNNAVTVSAGNGDGATKITAVGLKNFRTITVQGASTTDVALLTINGSASNYADISVNAFAELDVIGNYRQYVGFTTVAGKMNVATVVVDGGEINVAGILNGSMILGGGVIEGSGTINGNVTLNGGTILGGTISGDAYSYNNGLYTPAPPGGPLTINGNFIERRAAMVAVLRGTTSDQYSTINVTGNVVLQGGALQVDINGGSGFEVAAGQIFTLMTFTPGSLSGKFSTIHGGSFIGNGSSVDIGGGRTLRVVYNNDAGNIQLHVVSTPTSGSHWLGGTGNWNDADKWSKGVPSASATATINYGSGTYDFGAYTVTIDTPTSVGAIIFADSPWGGLAINNPWNKAGTGPQYASMAVAVAGSVTNASNMAVDYNGPYASPGGTVLWIGGALDNGRQLTIGNTTEPFGDRTVVSTSVSAARLINTGNILLLSSSETQTTLKIAAAAGFGTTGVVTGHVNLYGNDKADGHVSLEFGSGQITSIASGASLELHGSGAFVANSGSAGSNSALIGLANIGGRGNNGGIFRMRDGVVVTTTTSLVNGGSLHVDYAGPYAVTGGSKLAIGGVLTNVGSVAIGSATTSKPTTVTTVGLVNNGKIDLSSGADSTTALKVAAAAGFGTAGVLTGNVSLSGNALLEFGSGQITSIASGGASLVLTGKNSSVADSGSTGSNSALTRLSSIGSGFGSGLTLLDGASITTTTKLSNAGTLTVDNNGPSAVVGGSTLAIGGTLTNTGFVTVGAGTITKSTTMTMNGLNNVGSIRLAGGVTAKTTVTVNGAVSTSGTITIDAGAVLNLNGASNTLGGTISGAGEAHVVGAAVITDSLTQSGGKLYFLGGLANKGVILADGGMLFVNNTPVPSGEFQIGHGGTLDFAAGTSAASSVSFLPSMGTLNVGDPATFHAAINGFGAGDVINLTNTALASITSYSYGGGYLKLHTASGPDLLRVQGSYTTANFTLATDSSGIGTAITFHN